MPLSDEGLGVSQTHAVPISLIHILLFCAHVQCHHTAPSSTLLRFTVSFSVANTYRRGNLTPPPPHPCLYHSMHLVSLLWLPQSCSAGPQDVEGRAAARCRSASESSSSNPFLEPLKASLGRVMELREQWTSDPNCHPSSSKHWSQSSLAPASTQRRHATQLQLRSGPCVRSTGRQGFFSDASVVWVSWMLW